MGPVEEVQKKGEDRDVKGGDGKRKLRTLTALSTHCIRRESVCEQVR